jgi:23S rRNA (cytidine1920-2'-O)/16S rRNA (cytidine1409-2'-O)-methyltransferase
MRLDKYLKENEFVFSRTKAQDLIQENNVLVNNIVVNKNNYEVKPDDSISIKENIEFVSRAGDKLKQALINFNISVNGLICLDIGASTGGFTDCLIQNGAKKVYAVDVGNNQIHPTLKENKNILIFENLDIREFMQNNKTIFDFICVDVSFISLKYILPFIKDRFKKDLVLLYKPEFEVGKENLKQGIVKNEEITTRHLKDFEKFIDFLELKTIKIIKSKKVGKHGNQEYLIHVRKS